MFHKVTNRHWPFIQLKGKRMKKMGCYCMDISNLDIEDIANLDIGFYYMYVDVVECMLMLLNVYWCFWIYVDGCFVVCMLMLLNVYWWLFCYFLQMYVLLYVYCIYFWYRTCIFQHYVKWRNSNRGREVEHYFS